MEQPDGPEPDQLVRRRVDLNGPGQLARDDLPEALWLRAPGRSNNLTGKTNIQVATYYHSLYSTTSSLLEERVLATALSVYATTSSLGGTAGMFYGFNVSAGGLGAQTYNVGSNGAAFGVANSTTSACSTCSGATNNMASSNGGLYGGNSTKRGNRPIPSTRVS